MTIKEKIITEAKKIEEDCIYSSKGHFYASQFWINSNIWIGCIVAILSAIAGTSALSQFDYNNIIAGVLSLVVTGLTAMLTFVKPTERASLHHNAGNKYNELKNHARMFYDIEAEKLEDNKLIATVKNLDSRRNELNTESLQIPKWAFEKARKGIEEGEATYSVDENV